MMLPGAIYVGYVLIAIIWLAVCIGTSAVVCIGTLGGSKYIIDQTKTRKDMLMGKKPPGGKWPWWTNPEIWARIAFWSTFLIMGYVLTGPALFLLTHLKG